MTLKKALIKNFPRTHLEIVAEHFRFVLDITSVEKIEDVIEIQTHVSDLKFTHGISLLLGRLVKFEVQNMLEEEWPALAKKKYKVILSMKDGNEEFDWNTKYDDVPKLDLAVALVDICSNQGLTKREVKEVLREAQHLMEAF